MQSRTTNKSYIPCNGEFSAPQLLIVPLANESVDSDRDAKCGFLTGPVEYKVISTEGILVNELVYNPVRPSSPSASSISPANLLEYPEEYQAHQGAVHPAHSCQCDS